MIADAFTDSVQVAVAGASLGKAIGEAYGIKKGRGQSSQGNEQSSHSENSGESEQTKEREQSEMNSMFAMMFINIVYYDVGLDAITPELLTEAFVQVLTLNLH